MGPLAADTKHSNSETLETARRVRQPRQECSAKTAPTFTESSLTRHECALGVTIKGGERKSG